MSDEPRDMDEAAQMLGEALCQGARDRERAARAEANVEQLKSELARIATEWDHCRFDLEESIQAAARLRSLFLAQHKTLQDRMAVLEECRDLLIEGRASLASGWWVGDWSAKVTALLSKLEARDE